MASRSRSLTDLPDNAIEEILCRLPIKVAARTSVLSRWWRRRWLSIGSLDLSGLSRSQIYQILSLHLGPIHSLKIEELDPDDDISESEMWQSRDVEHWLTAFSLHSASSLRSLSLLLRGREWDLDLIDRCFSYLTHLELAGNLHVSLQFKGFTSLRVLHLRDSVAHPIEEIFELGSLSMLISACPFLEMLDVDFDSFIYPISLDIDAPNLRRLNLCGLQLKHFSVTSAPLLEVVNMNYLDFLLLEEEEDCRLMTVLRGMTTIKKLETNDCTLQYLAGAHVPERMPICFNNLRIISLDVNCGDKNMMSLVLCLLRSCPNLKELEMDGGFSSFEPEDDHDILDLQAQEDTEIFKNLETLRMTNTICTRHELDFIKFVLAEAHILKAVEISFNVRIKGKYSLAADLLEFPRVSNQARILLPRR